VLLVAILAAVVALVITGHTAWAIGIGVVGAILVLIQLLIVGLAASATRSASRRVQRQVRNGQGRL
jgi:threonine/homoserine/homoserine lactone efflux protein